MVTEENLSKFDIIIVGCGLSGIVIAERFSSLLNKKVLIMDKRNHIKQVLSNKLIQYYIFL